MRERNQMSNRIVIDPVTRIEGHAKITLHLDDAGQVSDAQFHVVEFRGFEKFCEGRPFREMPAITARICGICPVSHLLVSAKTGDALLAVDIPEAAANLRRLMHFGQLIQSHALSFFHLSSPDLLLGHDTNPAKRNIMGVIEAHPEIARQGIRLRKYGQEIIETLGGRKIHPSWAVPGGVSDPLTVEGRDKIKAGWSEAMDIITQTIAWFKKSLDDFQDSARIFGNFPSLFMAMVSKDGGLEHYDGYLRFVDAMGNIVADQLDPAKYEEYIGEAVESWSYLKFPYYKPMGYPEGNYRVGPLARLNVASHAGTPLADQELAEFRMLGRGAVLSSFHYHYARLIEILFCLERVGQMMEDPTLLDGNVRALAWRNRFEAVGCMEAPRGTLFHHYKVREGGLMTWANLIIATGQNNLSMNQTIAQIAKHYVDGTKLTEGMLNRVEAGIRAYDPCLSCSTHAAGEMPLHVQLFSSRGELLNELKRS